MEYFRMNLNPTERKTGDCVIRTIALAEGVTWYEVYDDLCALGRKLTSLPNSKDTYREYLKLKGYKKFGEPRLPAYHSGKKFRKALVWELEETDAIVETNRHLTCIKDGVLYDTWDSRNQFVRTYYKKV